MVENSLKSNKHAGPNKHVQWKFLPRHKEKLYGKIVNVPNLDNFLLQQLKMSRIKAQNAILRNKNVVLQILKKKVNVINLKDSKI